MHYLATKLFLTKNKKNKKKQKENPKERRRDNVQQYFRKNQLKP